MIHQTHFNIFEQIAGYIGWKDKNSCYLGCNKNLATILQLKSPANIIGLSDINLMGCTEKLFKFHLNNDRKALHGDVVRCIHKSTSPYDGAFYYFVKKPITDDKNNITGTIFHCQELIKTSFFESLYYVDKKNCPEELLPSHYEVDDFHVPIKLSARELECLFCMLRGMTAKEIGIKINLSKRTIESYIENIKNKFGCNTKSEMLIIAIKLGYMNFIPPRFLSTYFPNVL